MNFIEHTCFGSRCRKGAAATTVNDDGSTIISVPIEAWSDSKSFGGGGKYDLELRIEAFTAAAEDLQLAAEKSCDG